MGSFLTASVATLGVAGCNNSDSSSAASNSAPPPPEATGASWQFPQSVASGDPQADSIVLWTRVVPSALSATAVSTTDIGVRLQVSSAAGNAANLSTTTALSDALVANIVLPSLTDFDNTVRHKLTGLTAGTTYYYQFVAGTVRSKIGRFKTPPASASALKFAFITCQDWSNNHWGAFSDIVQNQPDLDFIVHLGDYIYETDTLGTAVGGVAAVESLHTQLVLPQGAALPTDPSQPGSTGKYAAFPNDYRYLYKQYRSDARLQTLHEQFPVIAIWDDHEFSDDCWGDTETYTDENQLQLSRRRGANQSWYEYSAADVVFNPANPSFTDLQIYRTLKFGGLADLILTDERLYRADHLIPETTLNPATGQPLGRINTRYLVPEASLKGAELAKEQLGLLAPGGDALQFVSVLGATQRAWWMSQMKNSTATWRIWGNEVTMMRLGLNGTNAIATLITLSTVSTLATNMLTLAAQPAPPSGAGTGGSVPTAAAIVAVGFAGAAFGVTSTQAATAGFAIAQSDAGGGTDTDKVTAAVGASGIPVSLAQLGVGAFDTAKAAAAGSQPAAAQAGAAAQFIATTLGIAADIMAHGASSVYVLALDSVVGPGTVAKITPFFQKFVLNADSWDGYRAERQALMQFLSANSISKVVNITGDLHAFLAGQVFDTFTGEVATVTGPDATGQFHEATAAPAGSPVVVDLVTAGISSTSWFKYVKQAVDLLDPTNALIGKLVYVPVAIPAIPANGLFAGSPPVPAYTASLNLVDYTMGKASPASPAVLANQLHDQVWGHLAAAGVPEPAMAPSTAGVLGQIAANSTFQQQAFPLAQQLATLGGATNPWLKHVDTDAQGYSVVSLTPTSLSCTFKKVNPLVGSTAPTNNAGFGTSIVAGGTTLTVNAATFPTIS
jgi:alkaline phosphatase D